MLDEKIILEWYNKKSKDKNIILIKEKAYNFIKWLQEAEENSENETEENSNEETQEESE